MQPVKSRVNLVFIKVEVYAEGKVVEGIEMLD